MAFHVERWKSGDAGIDTADEVDMEELVTPSHDEDSAGVRRWFECLAEHVRAVDFAGARPLFAADMIAFGTFTDFITGREKAEAAQWRNVWPHIDAFRWRPDIRSIVSPDRLTAVGMAIFDSTGYAEDGKPYERPGRATVVFAREGLADDWVALHTHMSLFRDVPTRSFKSKPEGKRAGPAPRRREANPEHGSKGAS